VASLNCNNINGDVITETTARIMYFGDNDNIHNIYNNARVVDEGGKLEGFMVNGILVPKDRAKEFYISLWYKFFKENKDIIDDITYYDEFYDGKPEGVINSPAMVFRIIKQGGLNGLRSNCSKFIKWLKNQSHSKITEDTLALADNENAGSNIPKIKETDFISLKKKAEKLANQYYKTAEKEDILNVAKAEGGEIYMRIVSVIYDKKMDIITEALYNMQLKNLKREIENAESNE